jgi:hypothetical protein
VLSESDDDDNVGSESYSDFKPEIARKIKETLRHLSRDPESSVPDLARLPNKCKYFLSVRMGSCTSGNIRVVCVMRWGRMVLMSPQGKHSYVFLEQCLDLIETLELRFVRLHTLPF